MTPPTSAQAIGRFGPYELDVRSGVLRKFGIRVKLGEQPLRILTLLTEYPGELVTREELRIRLWSHDTFVDFDHSLNSAVQRLRETLSDTADKARWIETVPRRGYRFVGVVEWSSQNGSALAKVSVIPSTDEAVEHPLPELPAPSVPRSRFFGWRWLAAVVVLLLAAAAIIKIVQGNRALPSAAPIRSLAVLPLENLSGDRFQEYFADGMTDELITELARIHGLRVVSRTSAVAASRSQNSLPQIADALKVDAIVEGSVLRSGNKIRITAQLIDARSDKHLWAQSFEGQANDILSLQDTVADEIAAQTRVALTAADRTRLSSPRSIRPEAYDDYLRGLYFIDRREGERAAQYFRSALDLEPTDAPAWSGLAQALMTEAATGRAHADDVMPSAIRAAKRAIELDPDNGEAYIGLGSIEFSYLRDSAAAERDLRRGIALSSGDPLGHVYLSIYLTVANRPDEALAAARRAMDLDPLGFFTNRNLGQSLYYDRRYEESLTALRRATEIAPDRPALVEGWTSAIAEVQGRYADAVDAELRGIDSEASPDELRALRAAFATGGWKGYQQTRIRFLLSRSTAHCNSDDLAMSYLRLGQVPEAFRWFQREADEHCVFAMHLAVDPRLDPFRHDPHYLALQDRLNLPH